MSYRFVLLGLLIAVAGPRAFVSSEVPLPDASSFLSSVQKKLRSDRQLLSEYTYTQREVHTDLDGSGKAKKTRTRVYEVFPGVEEWQTYKRLISEDGIPRKPEEVAKDDLKHRAEVEKELRKRSRNGADLDRKKAEEFRKEEEAIQEAFRLYDIRLVRREEIDGHASILMTFAPKPSYKPKTREGRWLQKIAGEAWFSETEHEMIKIDARVIDTISFGGIVARLNKGTRVLAQRQKFNNEVWLPSRVEFAANARVMLLKGFNQRGVSEYYDHKKYQVQTILNFGTEKSRP